MEYTLPEAHDVRVELTPEEGHYPWTVPKREYRRRIGEQLHASAVAAQERAERCNVARQLSALRALLHQSETAPAPLIYVGHSNGSGNESTL